MQSKRKTFSIDNIVAAKFEAKCFDGAINQSQIVEMLLEAFTLKGMSIFQGIIWSPTEPAKLQGE